MEKFVNARGTGKTRALIEYAKSTNSVVVCKNPVALAEKSLRYGIIGVGFISYGDFLSQGAFEDTKYVVDDADDFISVAYPQITALSMCNE